MGLGLEMINFDWGVSLGNFLTIGSFLVGGLGFVWTMKSQIDSIGDRTRDMEAELKKLVEVLIHQGRQDERLNSFDTRTAGLNQRLNELERRFNRDKDAA